MWFAVEFRIAVAFISFMVRHLDIRSEKVDVVDYSCIRAGVFN